MYNESITSHIFPADGYFGCSLASFALSIFGPVVDGRESLGLSIEESTVAMIG